MPSGGVYFIECGEYVKIGVTRRTDPFERMAEMYLPPNARMVAIIWGAGYAEETELHRMFRDHRVDREWFERCPELDALIAAYAEDDMTAPVTWARSGSAQAPTRGYLTE